jgi:hypothetical protein
MDAIERALEAFDKSNTWTTHHATCFPCLPYGKKCTCGLTEHIQTRAATLAAARAEHKRFKRVEADGERLHVEFHMAALAVVGAYNNGDDEQVGDAVTVLREVGEKWRTKAANTDALEATHE